MPIIATAMEIIIAIVNEPVAFLVDAVITGAISELITVERTAQP